MRELRVWQEGKDIIVCDSEFHYRIIDSFLDWKANPERVGLIFSSYSLRKGRCEREICDMGDCRMHSPLEVNSQIACLFILVLRLACGGD